MPFHRGEKMSLVSIRIIINEIRSKDRHVIGNHHVIQIIQRDIVIEENIDKENILPLTPVESQRLVRFQKRNPGFKLIVVFKVRSLCYSSVLLRGEYTGPSYAFSECLANCIPCTYSLGRFII